MISTGSAGKIRAQTLRNDTKIAFNWKNKKLSMRKFKERRAECSLGRGSKEKVRSTFVSTDSTHPVRSALHQSCHGSAPLPEPRRAHQLGDQHPFPQAKCSISSYRFPMNFPEPPGVTESHLLRASRIAELLGEAKPPPDNKGAGVES